MKEDMIRIACKTETRDRWNDALKHFKRKHGRSLTSEDFLNYLLSLYEAKEKPPDLYRSY